MVRASRTELHDDFTFLARQRLDGLKRKMLKMLIILLLPAWSGPS
jgi:hypothetical protein